MRILFFVPHLTTIYAGRTIYNGYQNAFTRLGHEFKFLTVDDDQAQVFAQYQPHMFFTSMGPYIFKFLDLEQVKISKQKGTKVFVNIPFWKSPFKNRANEVPSISTNETYVNLIKSGGFGDIYYNVSESEDPRMEGFEQETGYKHYTVPLALDSSTIFEEYDKAFKADISFLGTNLPGKRQFMREQVYPLRRRYDLKLYGQDWMLQDRLLGNIQRLGQYFNLPVLKGIQKPKVDLNDERKIYSSSIISINFHEDYQREFGGDCNERTFKIPACGGFEITDSVACIKKYFVPDKEIIIAESKADWFEKIDYYMANPDKRLPIIRAGKARALKDHTYMNRAQNFVNLYKAFSKS